MKVERGEIPLKAGLEVASWKMEAETRSRRSARMFDPQSSILHLWWKLKSGVHDLAKGAPDLPMHTIGIGEAAEFPAMVLAHGKDFRGVGLQCLFK